MKLLTLNTHSWQEEHMVQKFDTIVRAIMAERVDTIALQEVNQTHDGTELLHSPAEFFADWLINYRGKSEGEAELILEEMIDDTYADDHFAPTRVLIPETEAMSPTLDNYARLLVEALHLLGEDYHWYWMPAHTGYRVYDEGLAILSRQPFRASEFLVSDPEIPYSDYRRRVVLAAQFEDVAVLNGHFDWYQADGTGFVYEWNTLVETIKQQFSAGKLMIAGDFNQLADIDGEGYQYIKDTMPELLDSYHHAAEVRGQFTVPGQIDGWEKQSDSKRIDYVWTRGFDQLQSHEVIFDGNNHAVASDHFGLLINS